MSEHRDSLGTMLGSSLLTRAETRRAAANLALETATQDELGQHFTPADAAVLMAKMVPTLPTSGQVRVLDPGAGTGMLAAAYVARLLDEQPGVSAVEIVAVEMDPQVAVTLHETLADSADVAQSTGLNVTFTVIQGDFIFLSTGMHDPAEPSLAEPFDVVILNPPYRKLPAASEHRVAVAKSHGVDCPNIYAAFSAISAAALAPGGHIVGITPRSFANGPYFRAFRKYLLDLIALNRVHIFESRSTVFSDSGVLQENVIFAGTRGGDRDKVVLSVSHGHADDVSERVVIYDEVVSPSDADSFVCIPSDTDDAMISVTQLPSTLAELGLKVSTGKVVDFRAREYIVAEPVDECSPMVYAANIHGGVVEWPKAIGKGQAFVATNAKAAKQLIPSGVYVLIKRFSAKEERRRLVAGVWDPDANGSAAPAFDNKLNYIHADGVGLDRDLALGLCLWLNSTIVDNHFRTFSGHTQVNATDLKRMRFPSLESLRALGHGRRVGLPTQDEIDALVELELSKGLTTA